MLEAVDSFPAWASIGVLHFEAELEGSALWRGHPKAQGLGLLLADLFKNSCGSFLISEAAEGTATANLR